MERARAEWHSRRGGCRPKAVGSDAHSRDRRRAPAGFIAKRENEPSVYELDPKAVEELQKAASEVKDFQPPKDEKKK